MRRQRWKWMLGSALLAVLLIALCVSLSFAADDGFEKSIAAFPESYRVLLRELHTAHPSWEFVPMQTGLDWNTTITTESSGGRSLVAISTSYANVFKSKNTGDYNYSTDAYIAKDGGFCTANKFAVSYFMDPRNALYEENIFQFEQLSFDPSFDVDAVEVILSGTFMYQKKMTYLTANGESKTLNQTYAEAIFEAGETYDVNPCYLASKIRNEIGSTPSGSVTGKNATYPGIYNFYNIGASDGAGAITRGLAWAANTTAGTYQRPWNTPKKSIMGGAQYIVNTYIGKGQFTGYLQRFNVNPGSSYSVYTHQYMTNISGAAEQGYSAYRSYLSMGLLDTHFIFSIPVFQNMSGSANNSGTLTLADATSQTASVSTSSAINVRTGPSTNYDKLALTLAPGANLTILDTCFTDSRYYDSILRYPVWYLVRFQSNGTNYTGYVPAGFTKITNTKTVALGDYTPKSTSSNSSLYFKFVSMDARIISVVDDTKLNFLKAGSANVLAYDSTGRYAVVNYVVSETATPTVSVGTVQGITQTKVTTTGFTLQWNAVSGATTYRVYRLNTTTNRYEALTTTKDLSYAVSGLSAGNSITMKVKAYTKNAAGETVAGDASAPFVAKTIPAGPRDVAQSESYSNSVTLTWSGVSGAKSYQISQLDPVDNTYKAVQTTAENTLSISALNPATDVQFKVRALVTIAGTDYYTPYSEALTAKTGPEIVDGLKQSAATASSLSLQWTPAPTADGYKVYRYNVNTGGFALLGTTREPSFTVSGLTPGAFGVYNVKSYIKENGIVYYSSVSEEVLATASPDTVGGIKQFSTKSTCLKVQWNPVENATGYCVYRVLSNGKLKKIATTANTKALVSDLQPATHYDLQIRAFIRCNGKVYWGAYSAAKTIMTTPGKTANVTLYGVTSASFKLKWTAQSGVTGYRIYRYNSDKTYSLVATTTKNSIKISANTSRAQTYVVRSYIKENGVNYFGAYSAKIKVS